MIYILYAQFDESTRSLLQLYQVQYIMFNVRSLKGRSIYCPIRQFILWQLEKRKYTT